LSCFRGTGSTTNVALNTSGELNVAAGDVDHHDVNRCPACDAAVPAEAAWCGQCHARVGTQPTADGRFAAQPSADARFAAQPSADARFAAAPSGGTPVVISPFGAMTRPATLPPTMRSTRWGKTATTFGPVGRVLSTIALVAVLAVLVVGGLVDPFALGGAGVWLFVIMPWALRDIWRAGRTPVPDS